MALPRLGVCCIMVFSAAVSAAPILRLSNSVLTADVAYSTPASQTIEAYNIGDGTLLLTVSIPSADTWLLASVGGLQTCVETPCYPIQFFFKTANLSTGNYTARVTVSDPNAIDSPQVVIVNVSVGIAQAYDQYVAPGGTVTLFNGSTPCPGPLGGCPGPTITATTADGGRWLKVYGGAVGSFYYDYSIEFAPPATMAPGTYNGNVEVSGLGNISVTMDLTLLPIAVPSTNQIVLQLAQNGPVLSYPFLPYISLSNSGMGTLQVTGVSGSGTGVSAYNHQGFAIVTVDPGSLAPGTYTDGLVTIQCNGANCPIKVPISLEVDPQGPPIVNFQGVVDNAAFKPWGSPGDVMIVQGNQLSLQPPQYASGAPLPTKLGGASVLVNGVATPLYYSSFGQIAFEVRNDTYLGTALVQVVRDDQYGNTVSTNMQQFNPGIAGVTDTSYNAVDANHPATAGETLVFWALGLGPTSPVVADGGVAPASPPAALTVPVTVGFGVYAFVPQFIITPSFVGLSPGSIGLYQVTATVPMGLPKGNVSAFLALPGNQGSNAVSIAVQ